MTTKICCECKEEKPISAFGKDSHRKDGLNGYCRACVRSYQAVPFRAQKKAQDKRDLRKLVIKHYGGKCSCCGEHRLPFLALNHVNGGGSKERRDKDNGFAYRDARARNFPLDYNVLCHNCNSAIGTHGICPHQIERATQSFAWLGINYPAAQQVRQHKQYNRSDYGFDKKFLEDCSGQS